jgi:hypothetical protein
LGNRIILIDETSVALTALEPISPGNWLEAAEGIMEENGFMVSPRRSELLVWRERLRSGHLKYAEACSLRRIWLAPNRGALGVTSRRLYFSGQDDEIDGRPEQIVLSGSHRPKSPKSNEISNNHWQIIAALRKGPYAQANPVQLTELDLDLGGCREAWIGGNRYCSPPSRLNSLYRDHGFDNIPPEFTITLCALGSCSEGVTNSFKTRLQFVAEQRHLTLNVKKTTARTIKKRLNCIELARDSALKGHCVLFILPSKDEAPPNDALSLFGEMERNGVPFRRAYATDPLEYSIPDQLPSLLMAAGGLPHRSPTQVSGTPIWTIGVDLGHQLGSPTSSIVMTLVNPAGALEAAWLKVQPRDETARVSSITKLLACCRLWLNEFEPEPSIVVLRDGRLFENEDVSLYGRLLRANVSVFEFRKRGNPQIVRGVHPRALPGGPFAAILPDTSTMFIATTAPRDDRSLASIAKVTWRDEWNGLQLQPNDIAKLLASSATAPGLGLHPRQLPAAIYWADGIAGANDEDLRFRGVPVNRID